MKTILVSCGRSLVLTTLLLSLCGDSFAQEPSTTTLERQVESLRADLESLQHERRSTFEADEALYALEVRPILIRARHLVYQLMGEPCNRDAIDFLENLILPSAHNAHSNAATTDELVWPAIDRTLSPGTRLRIESRSPLRLHQLRFGVLNSLVIYESECGTFGSSAERYYRLQGMAVDLTTLLSLFEAVRESEAGNAAPRREEDVARRSAPASDSGSSGSPTADAQAHLTRL